MSLLMDALKQAEHAKRDKPREKDHQEKPRQATPASLQIPPLEEKESTSVKEPLPHAVASETAAAPVALSLSPAEADPKESEPALEFTAESPSAAGIPAEVTPQENTPTSTQASNHSQVLSEETATAGMPSVTASMPDTGVTEVTEGTAAAAQESPWETEKAQITAEQSPDTTNTLSDTVTPSPAAARVFAASQARQQAQRRRTLLGSIALVILLLMALAAYHFWASLSQTAPPPVPLALPPMEGNLGVDAIEDTTEEASSKPLPATPAPVPAPQTTSSGPSPLFDPRTRTKPETGEAAESTIREEKTEERRAAEQPPSPAIRFQRSTRINGVQQALTMAYEAYQSGRLDMAQQQYQQVLRNESHNRDALLGLAAIAIRQGNADQARTYYQNLLQLDPRDSIAQAGLLSLESTADIQTESELKSLLLQQPGLAPLHFALANLYAREQRWPLAQQSYFEAQRLAPENADYAYNLAISLEHLGQRAPALRYYQRALKLHQHHAGQFNPHTVSQRIAILGGQEQP